MEKHTSSKLKMLVGLGIVTLVLAAMAVFLITVILLPYTRAENTMDPGGIISIQEQDDGTLTVSWPAGENAQSHTIQVVEGNKVLFSATTEDTCSVVLPEGLPKDRPVTIRISSFHSYRSKQRPGSESLSATTVLEAPRVSDIAYTVDPDRDVLDVTYTMPEGSLCQVYSPAYEQGSKPVLEQQKNGFSLTFGETEIFRVPAYNESCDFTFRVQRNEKNLVFYGKQAGKLSLNREDFLGTALELASRDLGSNNYELYWNQTKGDNYLLEMSRDMEQWESVYTVANDGVLSYETGHLAPFSTYYFRIIAQHAEGVASAEPSVVMLNTRQRTVYSTVWPLEKLDVYAGSTSEEVLGTIPEGTACCVLGEENGRFAISYGNTIGYILSEKCMINLPEYMGELCRYHITNSYASRYTVHEFAIDQLTDKELTGYENVRLYDESFVVPMLYPTARKLILAAEAAQERGYRLCIYDSFHSRNSTLDIYAIYQEQMNSLVPKSAYSGEPLTDLTDMKWIVEEDIPQWVVEGYRLDRNGDRIQPNLPKLPPDVEERLGDMTTEEFWRYYLMRELTYHIFMTDNGRYEAEDYFARGKSEHNMGAALDITLETLDGEPVAMQTRMHDMSWFSETARNNENANILRDIMIGAGFEGCPSRWWHFTDQESISTLEPAALLDGVSIEGWVKDDQGWRYRMSNGRFYKNLIQEIDGTQHSFDENGYTDIDKV